MEAVGSSVLSPTLQVLFARIASNQEFLNFLFPGNRKVQLKRLMRVLRIVSPVLEDAENKQDNSPAVKTWFHGLKHAVYQADDVLDEIDIERKRIQVQHSNGNLSDTDFSDQFIGELSPRLEQICEALERNVQRIGVLGLGVLYGKPRREDKTPTTSVVIPSQIFGRDDEKEKIMHKVLLSGERGPDISVIPITGMGGVGKTTLAQLVYNDERVKNHFKTRVWVCVSEEFDIHRVTKDLLMKVNSSIVDEKDDLNRLQVKLKDKLEGKRFIIILDDIWNDNYNDCQCLMVPLRSGTRGSKIIVTTRNENIALMLQNEPFHYVKPIPGDQSWDLFKLHAFDSRTRTGEFEKIGKIIVERCKGLPLAIKTIAGALRSKDNICEWHDIMNSDNWMVVGDILPALSLSYKLLPSHLKSCFAFCAVFPKDVKFKKEEVALLWMANDLVQPSSQKVAQNYFEELRSLSFFEMVKNNKYVMHDLINDLARIVSGKFCARIEDYQLKDLHRRIQVKNDLPPEVLHFSYMSSAYDTLKKFRRPAQVQGLRTFLTLDNESNQCLLTTLFFSDILPKLRPIRALSLHQDGFSEIPYSIGDLKHLRFLNLARSDIKKLPNDMTQCLNLQTLVLARCRYLEELPEDMGLLINLQHLNVKRCWALKKLPEDMSLLINLQQLDISGCKELKELPKDMSLLINLQHLGAAGCSKLEKLPEDMRLLINLQHLDISGCKKLKELPNDMSLLTNLQQLDISGCEKLKELPKDMSLLINLQHLGAAGCSELEKLPEDMRLLINLQHLDISGCKKLKELPNDMSLLTTLQQLDISGCKKLKELPKDMSLLINLQHLDVSDCSRLKALPEDLRLLINLQHLNVSGCSKLEKLPEDMGRLTNLQYLDISGCSWLKALPEDFRLLSNLQHLDVSYCSELETLPEDMGLLINLQHLNIKGCWKLEKLSEVMGPLKHLDDLIYDKVCLISLDNRYTVEKAKNAELKNKSCIEELTLDYRGIPQCLEDELNIFSELIPHTNIRQLSIYGYKGTIFSNWLGDSSFCNIESLTLQDCKKCFHLPPLGQLTGLKRLVIDGMDAITEVGEEFYGNSSMCKPFPVLEKLKFSEMPMWTTWNTPPDNTELLSLKEIEIKYCPRLVGVPFLQTSPIISLSLQSRHAYQSTIHVKYVTNDSCNSSIEGLKIPICTETIPLFSFSKLQELKVEFWEIPNLFQFPNGYNQSLTSLQSLEIYKCNNILSFPEGGLPAPNLKTLHISYCSKLKSLPEQMHTQLSSLRVLWINDCPELECFPDGGLPPSLEELIIDGCKKVTMFPRNWGLQRLLSLIKLEIWGIEDKLFPEEGLLPASLKRLSIEYCPNLEALNHKGFQDITSLQHLSIEYCKEFRYLPEDGLPSSLSTLKIFNCPELRYLPEDGLPSSLSKLDIRRCPKLKESIEREWHKVSHIPIILVDWKLVS